MTKKRDNLRLGITVLSMGVLFVAVLLFIGSKSLAQPEMREFTVHFATGSGMPEIAEGSQVKCFGQTVGVVAETAIGTSSNLDRPELPQQQFLEIRARALAALNLREDCVVVAGAPPLGGKGYLEIVDRGISERPLDPAKAIIGEAGGLQAALNRVNAELDDTNPTSLISSIKTHFDQSNDNSLISRLHTVVGNIERITQSLADELDGSNKEHMITKLHTALDEVNTALADISGMLQENRSGIQASVSSLENTLSIVESDIAPVIAEELDPTCAEGIVGRVHTAFEKLDRSLEDINSISANVKHIVILNSDRINGLIENIGEAAAHLRGGIKDLRLHPWKLLAKPSAGKLRETEILDLAREFTAAAAHLDDATTRMKALIEARGKRIPADDPELEKIRLELDETVKKFFEAEQVLWEKMKE